MNKKQKLILIIALTGIAILFFAILCFYFYLKHGVTIVLTEDELRSGIERRFPLEKTHLLVIKIIYSNPTFEVLDNKNRIRIGLTATPEIEINEKTYSGSAIVNGGFKFVPEEGSFYLTGFTVEKIAINNNKGINLDRLSSSLSTSLDEIFKKHPVYVIPDTDLKHKIAKMVVKDIQILNKSIVINLGL